MTDPQITIGMPVYNNARTLRRAVQSVQAQTYRGWQLILSDDGSTDGAWEMAQALAAEDPQVTALQNETRQVYMNFRVPLEAAKTPYFVWLSADDYWGPRFLELALAALEDTPEAVSALPSAGFIGHGDRPYLPPLMQARAARISRFLAAPGGTRMYGLSRTQVLKAAFPPRNMHAYDWALMLGVLSAGPQITVPDVALFREKTPLSAYAQSSGQEQRGFFRWFPALDMSLTALRAGHVPWRSLGALARLNLRKHEEYLAFLRPKVFAWLRPVYALLGGPIARSPEKQREAQAAQSRPLPSAAPKGPPRLSALVTCRNAAPTLDRLIKHLANLGAEITVIDNGSTDATREIAQAHQPGPVVAIQDDPYAGYFDLTKQLRLKRQIIRSINAGWIIHADADEFLDPPQDVPLGQTLAQTHPDVLAYACDEVMYLPESETATHNSESFETTMHACVAMIERNQKERLFRAEAPLDHWMETGGHTVTTAPQQRAEIRLPLRHYFALSLDQVRSEYLSRVYASGDLAKLWHGSRKAGGVNIAPAPSDLIIPGGPPKPVRSVPVFQPRPPAPTPLSEGPIDLALVAEAGIREGIETGIENALPGLRVCPGPIERQVPHLHVMSHPAKSLQPDDVVGAEDWMRRIVAIRQAALVGGFPLTEMRWEETTAPLVTAAVMALLQGRQSGILLRRDLAQQTHPAYRGRLRRITGALAADLGYA